MTKFGILSTSSKLNIGCKMQDMTQEIETLESELLCPKAIALLRINLLEGAGSGFPTYFVPILRESLNQWTDILLTDGWKSNESLAEATETATLLRILRIYEKIAEMDPTLNEEIGREGSHVMLSKLIKLDGSSLETEEDQDTVMEIQDKACEIASMSKSFPLRVAPFAKEELSLRLPLSFDILCPTADDENEQSTNSEEQNGMLILINQVTARQSAQKDVGFVMWPSAVALSRWLVANPTEVQNKHILELGAGCGLVGLVAARINSMDSQATDQVTSVIQTDFNEIVVNNINQNIHLNGLKGVAEGVGLDFYQQDVSLDGWLDTKGNQRAQVDLILASDIICQPEDAYAAARSIFSALRAGGKAIVVNGDSKHRFGVERFEDACTELGMTLSTTDVGDLYHGRLLSRDMEKTSGYVDGMTLNMHIIDKVNQ